MNIPFENYQKLCLDVPFHTQLNNDSDHDSGWWNECGFTSMAMYLRSFGFVGDGNGQFEDQIERAYEKERLTRGEPQAMNRFLVKHYQSPLWEHCFEYGFTWQGVVDCLLSGKPVIAHTWLTGSGHILVIIGFDPSAYGGAGAWIVHDPFGEWFPTGYDTSRSGAYLFYSHGLARRLIGTDGDLWIHYAKKR